MARHGIFKTATFFEKEHLGTQLLCFFNFMGVCSTVVRLLTTPAIMTGFQTDCYEIVIHVIFIVSSILQSGFQNEPDIGLGDLRHCLSSWQV